MMEWKEFEQQFRLMANKQNKTSQYCEIWLSYSKRLFDQNIPIILSQKHFCYLVGYLPHYVYGACNKPILYYRKFSIPKKNGGYREIYEPLPSLKEIQKWILINILNKISISRFAKAFLKGSSIKENARFHINQKKVLSLDIKDYFGSIKENLVYSFFHELGYRNGVDVLLTKLCTLNGSLPQGAPTSPALSNLITREIDEQLSCFCIGKKLRYTRYADDITISGDFAEALVISRVKKVLAPYSLYLNEKKTRVRLRNQQQEVTGIVVNKKMQVSKDKRKELRKAVYYIRKYGLENHIKWIGANEDYLHHLIGIAGFYHFINPQDASVTSDLEFLISLLAL